MSKLNYVKLDGVIDLSYSKRQTLHGCPRKFLLLEMQESMERSASVDTAFGHAFGHGIAEMFRHQSLERAVVGCVAGWAHPNLMEENEKTNKSLWDAIHAIEKFWHTTYQEISEDWELAYFKDSSGALRPGIELFFYINIHNKYSYQGHIDIVLRNKHDGALCVLECKTSAREFHQADWQNSDQTLGYHIVLDSVAEAEAVSNSFFVKYLCYQTKDREFVMFEFNKSKAERSDFLTDLLMDVGNLELYVAQNFFPKRGNHCRTFNRVCDFFGTCDLKYMQKRPNLGHVYEPNELADADFVITLDEVLNTQQKQLDIVTSGVSMFTSLEYKDENEGQE